MTLGQETNHMCSLKLSFCSLDSVILCEITLSQDKSNQGTWYLI